MQELNRAFWIPSLGFVYRLSPMQSVRDQVSVFPPFFLFTELAFLYSPVSKKLEETAQITASTVSTIFMNWQAN